MEGPAGRKKNSLSTVDHCEIDSQQPRTRRKSIIDKVRNSLPINLIPWKDSRPKSTEPNLDNFNLQSQELILRTVDKIKQEDSQGVINVLGESRHMLSDIFEELKREQEECRRQFQEISKLQLRPETSQENAIPLSIFMKRKQDNNSQSDSRSNSSMSSTYQAHLEALITSDENDPQHPLDKAAVLKYIRRRERRKRAEENKKKFEVSNDVLEQQTAEIMQKMEGMDAKVEHERQRQNERIRTRINEKKIEEQNRIQASEIIEQANEADLIRQRDEKVQREKIEARLSAARQQQKREPTNLIHVKSAKQETKDERLNDEQIEITKQSLQLLQNNDQHHEAHSTAFTYGDKHESKTIASIEI